MADDKTDWDIDRVYRYLVDRCGPQAALPELVTALHSGRLTIIMTTRDGYDGRVTWRGELGADWFRGYLDVRLTPEGEARVIMTRALVGFGDSMFTVPAWRVRRLWPKSSSAKAEAAECWTWLEQLAKDHPDRQPKPKPSMWGEAKARWPRLSRRAFDRGWCNVIEAGATWARPGRPKRNPAP
jgi:hypothetical protein